MHLNEAELRTYQDDEMQAADQERARAHLAECAECDQAAAALAARAERVAGCLAALMPQSSDEAPVTVQVARARLETRISNQEATTMWQKLFQRRYRPAWTALAVVIALAIALAFPPVRAIATDFLGLFRVQRIAVIEVNPANVPEFDHRATEIENLLSESMQVEELGEPQEVGSAAEAGALAGIPVRLPTAVEDELARLSYQPGSRVTFEVDLPRTRLLLEELGRSDIVLPDQLEDTTVTVELPNSVTAAYGACEYGDEAAEATAETEETAEKDAGVRERNCTVLVQMPSPTISAPPELPIGQLGEAWLQLMGLTAEEAAQFSQTVDWSTTLVVPIPSRGTTTEEVVVDGVTGTLITQSRTVSEYMLLWVKNDIVYALTGVGDGDTALAIANSLE